MSRPGCTRLAPLILLPHARSTILLFKDSTGLRLNIQVPCPILTLNCPFVGVIRSTTGDAGQVHQVTHHPGMRIGSKGSRPVLEDNCIAFQEGERIGLAV